MNTQEKLSEAQKTLLKWHGKNIRAREGKRIIIDVSGGVIQDICGIPKGLTVEVRDFDTDGTDAGSLTDTPDGQAIVSTWEAA